MTPAARESEGCFHAAGFTISHDGSGVGLKDSREDLHQSGFARAVFAYQGVNRPLPDAERDIFEGLDGAKALTDPLHLEGELGDLDLRGQRHQPSFPMSARISGEFKRSLVTSSTPVSILAWTLSPLIAATALDTPLYPMA